MSSAPKHISLLGEMEGPLEIPFSCYYFEHPVSTKRVSTNLESHKETFTLFLTLMHSFVLLVLIVSEVQLSITYESLFGYPLSRFKYFKVISGYENENNMYLDFK